MISERGNMTTVKLEIELDNDYGLFEECTFQGVKITEEQLKRIFKISPRIILFGLELGVSIEGCISRAEEVLREEGRFE